ncbi:hypothetical protein FZD47_22000 [Bacillus infantis]|uniref:IS256 family transposase n=1 Tax=Bacillus infantis TaxID=324767 RepID=A0A5D4S908_9BACI|nr:hypothetical protein [Bacillus infantis]TYS59379.1 hypothetical protein FZD47_22000 [Bacillus infantis]
MPHFNIDDLDFANILKLSMQDLLKEKAENILREEIKNVLENEPVGEENSRNGYYSRCQYP